MITRKARQTTEKKNEKIGGREVNDLLQIMNDKFFEIYNDSAFSEEVSSLMANPKVTLSGSHT